jgi:hypothetical protein
MARQPLGGLGRLIFSSFTITHFRHTTVGRTPLDEGPARRRDLYLTTHNTHKTDIHDLGGIRTHNPSKRAAVDPRLRPRGHCFAYCAALQFVTGLLLQFLHELSGIGQGPHTLYITRGPNVSPLQPWNTTGIVIWKPRWLNTKYSNTQLDDVWAPPEKHLLVCTPELGLCPHGQGEGRNVCFRRQKSWARFNIFRIMRTSSVSITASYSASNFEPDTA